MDEKNRKINFRISSKLFLFYLTELERKRQLICSINFNKIQFLQQKGKLDLDRDWILNIFTFYYKFSKLQICYDLTRYLSKGCGAGVFLKKLSLGVQKSAGGGGRGSSDQSRSRNKERFSWPARKSSSSS